MKIVTYLTLFISVALLNGCALNHYAPNAQRQSQAPQSNAAPVCEEENCNEAITLSEEELINYTKTAADYKEFGERSPRDQNIVTANVGSNLSASVPPTIENEVTDYEAELSMQDGNGTAGSESSSQAVDDPVEDWLAEEGQNLKALLTEWSDRAGWRLVWKTNRNYPLTAGAMFRGRYADVASALIRTFARAKPAPIGTFYKGNRVLVVETMEDENAF